MTEERLDGQKLEYIANRSERGREAVDALWRTRVENDEIKRKAEEKRRGQQA